MVEIYIENRILYLGAFMVLTFGFMGIVFAYGTGDPTVNGHDMGELDIWSCNEGDLLRYNGTEWVCGNGGVVVGGYGDDFSCWGEGVCTSGCPAGSTMVETSVTGGLEDFEVYNMCIRD
jgi:hypothetical protein